MGEYELYRLTLVCLFVASGIIFFATGSITAPYGRHHRTGWGPQLPWRLGWIVMEAPCVLLFAGVFLAGARADQWVPRALAVLWLVHYVHRAFVYPLQVRGAERRLPLVILAFGLLINIPNSYVNARSLSEFGPVYDARWLLRFRFLYGLLLFVAGFVINRWSDVVLSRLRAPGETGYKIPRGGLFEEVSCPNYLGEVVQWLGWAILTWSQAGFAFAALTAANLIPRAISHHNWYRRNFPGYPRRRRAIIPYLL